MISKKAALIGTLALVALSFPMGAVAANKLIVKDAAGSVDKMVVTDSGYVGVGTNAPAGPIHVVSQGGTQASAGFTVQHTASILNGVDPSVAIAPNFSLYRNNDSTLNTGLPRDGDALGYFGFGSVISGSLLNRAIFFAKAEGAWTTNNTPALYQYMLNPGSGLANREILRLSGGTSVATVNGGLRLFPYTGTGSTTPIGTGANPPSKPVCDATTQGTLWFTKNSTAKDVLELCANGDATGTNFAWRSIAF